MGHRRQGAPGMRSQGRVLLCPPPHPPPAAAHIPPLSDMHSQNNTYISCMLLPVKRSVHSLRSNPS